LVLTHRSRSLRVECGLRLKDPRHSDTEVATLVASLVKSIDILSSEKPGLVIGNSKGEKSKRGKSQRGKSKRGKSKRGFCESSKISRS
jgi:hypothetical protein